MEQAVSILNSRNVVVGSTISAGGNIEIGDRTIHTESDASRRLRLLLYVFVPLLAIGGAFFWVRYQQLKEPLSLSVALNNLTPNPELLFEGGTVTLLYGDKSETLAIRVEADFKGIPSKFRDEKITLRFEAPGFVKLDTAFVLSSNRLTLPIRRDNSLTHIFGTVKDGQGNPVADAQIIVQEITGRTDEAGNFSMDIPFEKQRREQQIRAYKIGYEESNKTYTIVANEDIGILLPKK